MCYYSGIARQGREMRLLPVAVEKQRWDLVAHTIILATASVLKNGAKPPAAKMVSRNLSLRLAGGSGVGSITKTGGGEFGRQKRGAQR